MLLVGCGQPCSGKNKILEISRNVFDWAEVWSRIENSLEIESFICFIHKNKVIIKMGLTIGFYNALIINISGKNQ